MVFAFAGDSTITSGLATTSSRLWQLVLERAARRGQSGPHGPLTDGHPGAHVVPRQRPAVSNRAARSRCRSAPCCTCSVLLGISLDPKEIIDSLSPYGEIGLWLIIFAETGLLIGFFLPGDSLLFTAGLLAGQGQARHRAASSSAASSPRSSAPGRLHDRQAARTAAVHASPTRDLFKQEYVERTKAFFERHGPKTIVIARFVPIVRTFTPVMAGVGEMHRRTFTHLQRHRRGASGPSA